MVNLNFHSIGRKFCIFLSIQNVPRNQANLKIKSFTFGYIINELFIMS